MCFCTPNVRTPVCPNCHQAMFARIKELEVNNALLKGELSITRHQYQELMDKYVNNPQPDIPDDMVVLFEKAIHHLKQHAAEYGHPGQHKLISDMEAMLAAAPKPEDI